MGNYIDEKIKNACEAIGDLIEYWGFKKIQGKVWTYLVISKRPRSHKEIVEFFGVSKALISLTLSELSNYNLVENTEGKRNSPFKATLNIWPTVSDILRSREWMLLENAKQKLESLKDFLAIDDGGEYRRSRVLILLNVLELIQNLLKFVVGFSTGGQIKAIGSWVKRAGKLLLQVRNS